MAQDRRNKGCPNEACSMHQKQVRQKSSINYCPECGAKLIYVCRKCFREIQDLGPEHAICAHCEAEASEKREKAKETVRNGAGKVVKGAAGAVVPVGIGIINKVGKDAQNAAIKAGAGAVKKVAHAAVKSGAVQKAVKLIIK